MYEESFESSLVRFEDFLDVFEGMLEKHEKNLKDVLFAHDDEKYLPFKTVLKKMEKEDAKEGDIDISFLREVTLAGADFVIVATSDEWNAVYLHFVSLVKPDKKAKYIWR